MAGSDAGTGTNVRIDPAAPPRCPACGGMNIARLLYGEPSASTRVDDLIASGQIKLGGCDISDHSPEYSCNVCGLEFRATPTDDPESAQYPVTLLPSAPRPGDWAVGRLVLTGDAASGSPKPDPRTLLATAIEALVREGVHVRYLLTPAGFLRGKTILPRPTTRGWHTDRADFSALRDVAEETALKMLNEGTFARARGRVDYIVIGVDIRVADEKAHAEVALVVDVQDERVVGATGKTYPTNTQERKLVRNVDPCSHMMDIAGDRLCVLVCHDLIAWSPKGQATAKDPRLAVARTMHTAVAAGDPTVVLHLPHTIHSAQAFANSWTPVLRTANGAPAPIWTGAIKYRTLGDSHRPDKPLDRRLLARTKGNDRSVVDIVIGDYTLLET